MKWVRIAITAPLLLAVAVTAHASQSIYDFNVGNSLTITNNGVTAIFDAGGYFSASDPGAVAPITGNFLAVLGTPSFAATFSSPESQASLDFAEQSATAFTVNAYRSGVLVETASDTGSILPGGSIPQGSISLTDGVVFDELVFSSSATAFGIDNLLVTHADESTPEPGILSLFAGAFFAGAAGVRRKLRVRSQPKPKR